MRRNSLYLNLLILAGWLGLLFLCSSLARAAKNTPQGPKKEVDAKTQSGTFISMEGVKADYPKIDWVEVNYDSPGDRKIHLCNPKQKITAFDWTPGQDVFQSFGDPPYASYKYDKATDTETFQVYGNRSNRSEIRLYNEYEFGATQFEGYVTFYPPTDDECLMQIWGSDEGATQLMVRAYGDKNGSIGINFKGSGTPKVLHDLYGKETKVNVIHLQEDMGNKIMVFLNDKKVAEYPDNEKAVNHNNKNYHKWGLYGTVKPGHENPKVVWRTVRHYAAGAAIPVAKNTQPQKPDQTSMIGAANTETTAERQMETALAAKSETRLPKSLKAALLPAIKNGGFSDEGHILWCPSVIKVGDTYHMFCSRWPDKYDMGGWTKYSECVHATSKNLCGPYEFKEVVLQKRPDNWDNTRVHNPKIVKAGDTYVIYYIDTANETGFAYSKSIDGPWTRVNQPVMKVSNPAIYVKPDNSIYVFGRLGVNGRNRAIAFSAPTFKGPYTLLRNGENLLPDDSFTLEDPTIWWANNQYNVLLNDFSGKATGTKKGGAQFFSKDGLHYTLVSTDPVFTKKIEYDDGSTEIVNRRERPFVYADEEGKALALFTACYYKTPEGKMSAKIVANPIDHYVPNN